MDDSSIELLFPLVLLQAKVVGMKFSYKLYTQDIVSISSPSSEGGGSIGNYIDSNKSACFH